MVFSAKQFKLEKDGNECCRGDTKLSIYNVCCYAWKLISGGRRHLSYNLKISIWVHLAFQANCSAGTDIKTKLAFLWLKRRNLMRGHYKLLNNLDFAFTESTLKAKPVPVGILTRERVEQGRIIRSIGRENLVCHTLHFCLALFSVEMMFTTIKQPALRWNLKWTGRHWKVCTALKVAKKIILFKKILCYQVR